MVDLTTLTTAQYFLGALSIAPVYTVASFIKKSITGEFLPKTKLAAQITLVELVAGLAAAVPVLADKNLDKPYEIKELINTIKATLPCYLPKLF